ncbi:MAG: WbqC family protein [Bacteroidales bacterium]|nr:WbqC family protein [Bacteroidales bacterium]
MIPLLSTSFLPPVEYFAFLTQQEVQVESCEHYQKQSFRTRCAILTANGRETLSLPVVHCPDKEPIRETRIDYSTPWQRTLWRAIESAYGGSPFFLYYRDAIQPFFEKRFELLFDYNLQIIKTLISTLRLPAAVSTTEDFLPMADNDLRELIHPRRQSDAGYPLRLTEPYYQVFAHKFGFVPNLSVIDLLFNLGPEAGQYLQRLHTRFQHEMNL